MKVFTGVPGYHPDCGEQFPSLKGSVAGVTETSTHGGNSVGFTIANPGGGAYTFTKQQHVASFAFKANVQASDAYVTVTSTAGSGAVFQYLLVDDAKTGYNPMRSATAVGTGYANGDTFVILGTALNGATPANDCTITITDASLTGQFTSNGGFSVSGTPFRSMIFNEQQDLDKSDTGVTETSTSGAGSAHYTIKHNGAGGAAGGYTVQLTTPGTNYVSGDTLVVSGLELEGLSPANDATITISDAIGTATVTGVPVSSYEYVVGDTIKILGTSLGGATPANDCTVTYGVEGVDQTTNTPEYGWMTKASDGTYNAGTPKTLDEATVNTCFETEMAKTCSTCTAKSTAAAMSYMMGGATSAEDAKIQEMMGLLNEASCTTVQAEGFCVKAFAGIYNAFESKTVKANTNPYCDKTKLCPKKFMAKYIGAIEVAKGSSDPAVLSVNKMMRCAIFRRMNTRNIYAPNSPLSPPLSSLSSSVYRQLRMHYQPREQR